MRNKITVFLIPLLFAAGLIKAQDPQFSQFYAAPLYLNPSMAGSTELTRVGANYRNQWPSIDANFVTYSAYFDHYFIDYNSGVGLLLMSDQEGVAGMQSNSVAADYSYQVHLTENWAFRAGLEGSYTWRSLDFGRLIFSDQLSVEGIIKGETDETFNSEGISFFDLAAGGMFYGNNLWVGFAAHHLLQPNQSLIGSNDQLPRKYSIHAGYKIDLPSARNNVFAQGFREVNVTPTLNYKMQGDFKQFDLGMYVTYEPVVFGASYRGIPFNAVEGFMNNESVIGLIGITTNGLNIGYSFDMPISRLGFRTGGVHELSISYQFFMGDPRKPPKNVRKLPCPKF